MGRALIFADNQRSLSTVFAYAAFFREETVLVPYFFRARAALLACRESALCEAAELGSFLSAACLLREREADAAFFLRLCPRA